MKRILPFSKLFLPAAVLSTLIIAAGIAGYVSKGGFNLGVDFQAGSILEVRFAPSAFGIKYRGFGNASIALDRTRIDIVISGSGVERTTHSFPFATHQTIGALGSALSGIEGIEIERNAPETVSSQWLVQSAQGNPQLGALPYMIHYIDPISQPVAIETIRDALSPVGTAAVQRLGQPSDQHFMIRLDDKNSDGKSGVVRSEEVINVLESAFGQGEVALTRSDYVGSRFSKHLTDQAGLLLALTLVLILGYASIRFKPWYALGAVIAIAHDALIMVTFIVWSRMEFNTTTIAAILTILGYSINDTIVVFDRIREVRHIYPDEKLQTVLNRSLSDTLSRTIITTVTTLLAVLSLFIFTKGAMKDFAMALLVGMISGVYSTIFIASGFVNFVDLRRGKKNKRPSALAQPAKA